MRKSLLPAGIVSIILLTACAGNPPTYNTATTDQSASFPAMVADSSKVILVDTPRGTVLPNSQSAVTSPPAQTATAKKNAGALNPAHGQPGHRCDISVGVPLSTPIQKVQQASTPSQSVPAPPSAMPNANGTAKLNPAHGMPGHDCAVAVGQPLKN